MHLTKLQTPFLLFRLRLKASAAGAAAGAAGRERFVNLDSSHDPHVLCGVCLCVDRGRESVCVCDGR